jgi:epoxyqueuosine reductase
MKLRLGDREWITQRAVAAGFDLAGVADVPDDASVEDGRFAAFVEAGHAGEMEYLKRADAAGEYVRGDLRRAMPWARTVIVCAVNYNADAPLSVEPADAKAGCVEWE